MNELKATLQAELAGLSFIDSDFKLVALNGGTINSSYRLTSAGKQYFVKTFESDQFSQLDRLSLFAIQKELAAKGIAVEPVYLSKTNQFQIDHWVEGSTLDQVPNSSIQVIKQLAKTLAKIHAIKIDAPVLDLPAQWQIYLSTRSKSNSKESTQKYQKMLDLWQRSCAQKSVFCHNDLALAHITSSVPHIVFDWEYCGISCPFFDLASCIKVNDFSATDVASLCAYYARYTELSVLEVTNKVKAMQPLVDYTYSLWYQAASNIR